MRFVMPIRLPRSARFIARRRVAAVRVAVIGAGFGNRVVAEVLREQGVDVDVVSARDPDAVRAAIGAPVDLVSVHSPPFLHTEHVRLALDAGHDVLCDKPFGCSATEAGDLLAAARDAGVLHFVNFEFRRDPTRLALQRVLDDGRIGAPVHLHWTSFTSASRRPLRRYGWLFDRARGGGWIGAFGSHVFDTVRWLMGEIVDARGGCRIDVTERPDDEGRLHECTAEDAFTAHLRLASGATATIDTAFAAPVNVAPRITVFGTDGEAELIGATELRVRRAGEETHVTTFEPFAGDMHFPAMRPWLAEVVGAVERREQLTPSFADGAACAEVMDILRTNAAWPGS
jgi:predicted dehydrogenase